MNEYQELIAQAKEIEMSELIEEYAALKRRQKEIKTQLKDVAPKAFRLEAQRLFDAHPALESFGWNQYTPYFNDGDECVFRSNHTEPDINGYDPYDKPPKDDLFYGPAKHKEVTAAVRAFTGQFSQDDIREIFGDHVQVEVTKEGITTEAYDHE